MSYLSISARVLVNVEALNMAESIGNYVKHRRIPMVVEEDEGIILRYVPALSGETLAHGYQENLANIASLLGMPVCELCKKGTFTKHSSKEMFGKDRWEDELKELLSDKDGFDPTKFESLVIKNCVVENIGGFLYAESGLSVKRTSLFRTGYLIPALDGSTSAAVEPQFHVRYAPEKIKEGQAIYYVETGSALYTLTMELDVSGIGKARMLGERDVIEQDERNKSIEVAIKAMAITLAGPLFGAKRSRFLPSWEVRSAVLAVSTPIPFTVSPGHSKGYLDKTIKRAESLLKILNDRATSVNQQINIYWFDEEGLETKNSSSNEDRPKLKSEKIQTLEELFHKALEDVLGGD